MAQKVRITYYGIEGEGVTLKEARADAARNIEVALEGSYTPKLLEFGNHQALVWREPVGWGYRLLNGADTCLYPSVFHAKQEGAERQARYHLAQSGWEPANDGPALAYVHRDDRATLATWIAWQRRYAHARAEGLSDVEAHRKACGF